MDPFEEFEFKPLTEGLGFHNRSAQAQAHSSKYTSINSSVNSRDDEFKTEIKARVDFHLDMDLMAPDAVNSSATMSDTQIQTPLPRRETPVGRTNSNVNSTVDDILKTLGERKKYTFTDASDDSTESMASQNTNSNVYISSTFEFSAALLDGMLIVASYLASMIIMLMVTKVDLFANLLNPDEEGLVYLGLFGIFAVLTWSYLVINRMFLGFTPGEWVFDQRLGRPEQMGTANYSLKVALRSLLVLATGFILMPLASMITRRDLIGKVLGVELIKKV